MPFDDIDGFTGGDGGRERSEIAAAVLDNFTRGKNTRPRMPRSHFNAEITFVVLQPNIIAGLVLLDQVVFEDQRLFVRGGNQRLEILDALHQELHLRSLVRAVEISAYTRAQILRLADINHLTRLVSHQVDAGTGRQVCEFFRNRLHASKTYAATIRRGLLDTADHIR